MSDFGFGSLTGKSGQIKWEQIQKYDTDKRGDLDVNEYNAMLKDEDPDGFNGITAFGKMDINGDTKITQEEFNFIDQQVLMSEIVDKKFESLSTDKKLTADLQAAVTSYLNNYAQQKEYTVNSENISQMSGNFEKDLETFISDYQTNKNTAKDTSQDVGGTKAQALIDSVNIATENGYLTNAETKDIKEKSYSYALSAVLSGDYSFLTDVGADVSSLKTLVSNYTSGKGSTLEDVESKIKELIKNASTGKIITASAKLKDTIDNKAPEVNTINPIELNYPKGYSNNEEIHRDKQGPSAAETPAKADIESLKEQMRGLLEAQCSSAGSNLKEDLFNNIFSMAEDIAITKCVTGQDSAWNKHSKSSYKTKDLIDTFVNNFNELMAKSVKNLNAKQTDSNGVPTKEAIISSYLDDDSTNLNNEEKEVQYYQKDLLVSGDKEQDIDALYAFEIMTTLGKKVKAQMKESLGSNYNEAVVTNIINDAISDVMKTTTAHSTSNLVSDFVAAVQTKYAQYKSTKSSFTA